MLGVFWTFAELLKCQELRCCKPLEARRDEARGKSHIVLLLRHAFLCLSLLFVQSTVAQPYKLTPLGTLGGSFSVPSGISNLGQVTGNSSNSDSVSRAFLYQNGAMADLGTLGGFGSSGLGISNAGTVVGEALTTGNIARNFFIYESGNMKDLGFGGYEIHISDSGVVAGTRYGIGSHPMAFKYIGGVLTNLGTLGGTFGSFGIAVNNSGVVVGQSYLSNNSDLHAFVYADGQMIDLAPLGGRSAALAINNLGQVTGMVGSRAFIYENGVMTDIGAAGVSIGQFINDSGQVVGTAEYFDKVSNSFVKQAFLYKDGAIDYLGHLGGRTTTPLGLNEHGSVVGVSSTSTGELHPFLYSNGHMTDIYELFPMGSGWILGDDHLFINDLGQIAGFGSKDGVGQAWLLSPVPEPALWVHLLAGLGLLTIVLQRCRSIAGRSTLRFLRAA